MKALIKVQMVVDVEYFADSESYGCSSVEEMAAIDKANFEDDPASLLELNKAVIKISVEVQEVKDE
jgi:hypothetical protein